jgi:hypothetical protein
MKYATSPNDFKLRVMGIESSVDLAKQDMEKSMEDQNNDD